MHRARAFFYVCAGIFLLALSYHLGARSATAQAGQSIAAFSSGNTSHCSGDFFVITPNGDVYGNHMAGGPCGTAGSPEYIGNFWAGPTATTPQTLGQLRARYR